MRQANLFLGKEMSKLIMETRTSLEDLKNKCGTCKFFDTTDGFIGYCVCNATNIKDYNRNRKYNSRACKSKEIK